MMGDLLTSFAHHVGWVTVGGGLQVGRGAPPGGGVGVARSFPCVLLYNTRLQRHQNKREGMNCTTCAMEQCQWFA